MKIKRTEIRILLKKARKKQAIKRLYMEFKRWFLSISVFRGTFNLTLCIKLIDLLLSMEFSCLN